MKRLRIDLLVVTIVLSNHTIDLLKFTLFILTRFLVPLLLLELLSY